MRTFAQEQNQPERRVSSSLARSNTATFGPNHHTHPILHLQRAIGNQALQRMLQTDAQELEAGSTGTASPRFGHDLSQVPKHPPAAGAMQTKLAINQPGDDYEREADHVSKQVMRMSEPQLQRACPCGGGCPRCQAEQPSQGHERLQTRHVGSSDLGQSSIPPIVHEVLRSPGQPLDPATRAFMEQRIGHDFSGVRVHSDSRAVESARALGARAYTVGSGLVFEAGQYAPGTAEGRRLLAHELTHVVQQRSSGTDRIQRQPQGTQAASGSKRVPPGEGEYTPKEYEAWLKAHPKREYRIGGPWEPDAMYARYTPQWFWAQGYVYAGKGGNFPWYWFEVWISSGDGGKEFRVWRTSDAGAKTAPSAKPPGPATQKAPPSGPDYIDPNADRESLFGPIIAAREDVDAAFGEGDVVLYDDGTAELFLKGTTQSYVFRPVLGGRYAVYGPSGKRLDKLWIIPEEDIPDPITDAVE